MTNTWKGTSFLDEKKASILDRIPEDKKETVSKKLSWKEKYELKEKELNEEKALANLLIRTLFIMLQEAVSLLKQVDCYITEEQQGFELVKRYRQLFKLWDNFSKTPNGKALNKTVTNWAKNINKENRFLDL